MSIILDGTLGITPASWTTAGRPSSPTVGQSGWNSTLNVFEIWTAGTSGWVAVATQTLTYSIDYIVVAGGAGGGSDNAGGGGAGG